jgi:signal transduction histidine kinase
VVLGLIVLYPTDILFDPIFAGEYKTTLAEALSSNYSITNLGRLVGFAILVLVAVSCLGVLFKLNSSKKKEGWLTLGVFVTLVCSAHDAILGATAFLSTIPIYYLGNVFEAIRFTSHYQKKSYSDLKTLEKENIVNKALADEGSVSKKLLRLLSHDINNGVTVSRFGVRKSRRFLEDRDKLEDGLKKIERGLNIIDDISEIVRLVEASRSGMLELDLREVDLRKSIDQVLENFEDRLKEKNLVVRVEVNEAIPSVVAEPISLSNEVIANLLSNAIKFSPENSVVQISAYSEGEFVLLEVKDHGVGIPRELVNVLFDDNSQTTRAGTNGELGNGFGMPLMKNFVENYGGCVEVESETSGDGKGTKFKVFLKSA